MHQKIDPINDSEAAWIRQQLEAAANFVATHSPADAKDPLSLAALDRAFAAWMASAASQPGDADALNPVINCVGIAFGRALVEGAGFRWVIATDKHGTELAVHALPGRGDVLVYPANFVAKRWERRETNFLEDSFRRIEADLAAISEDWK